MAQTTAHDTLAFESDSLSQTTVKEPQTISETAIHDSISQLFNDPFFTSDNPFDETLETDTDSISSTEARKKIDAQQLALQTDSLLQAIQANKKKKFVPDPIRAMWLGLILPGGGQIYNKKYWKLPIIYGGFLGCAYALSWNNQMLRDYSQAYLDIMDSDPNTQSYMKMLPLNYNISGRESQFQEIFKNKKNYYRKYRDMSIFAFAAVYVLAVIDAYVDAELSTFDISRDLSLRMAPAVISNSDNNQLRHATHNGKTETGVGLACRLSF